MTAPEHDPACDEWRLAIGYLPRFEAHDMRDHLATMAGRVRDLTTPPDMPVRWEGDDS